MLKRLFDSKVAAGVEVLFLEGGKYIFNVVILNKAKSKISIAESYSGIEFEEVLKKVETDIPIYLVLNGKGIIHKKIPISEKDNFDSLLHKIFPNAKPEEFYVQHTTSDKYSEAFMSVIRRESAEEIISQFSSTRRLVVSSTLGPFGISSILPLLDSPVRNEISFVNHKLSIYEGSIQSYQPIEANSDSSPLFFGEETVRQELVLAFASAISNYSGFVLANNIESALLNKESFKQKTIFKTAGWGVLIFFLVTLLINFFLFNQFNKKKQLYASAVSRSMNMLEQLDTLKKQIAQQQEFLEGAGLLEASRISFYSDRLAMDVLSTIQLSQMIVSLPLKSGNDLESKLSFLKKNIVVDGFCKHSTELNAWMNLLKKKDWIDKVSILFYQQDKAQEDGKFSIEIVVK